MLSLEISHLEAALNDLQRLAKQIAVGERVRDDAAWRLRNYYCAVKAVVNEEAGEVPAGTAVPDRRVASLLGAIQHQVSSLLCQLGEGAEIVSPGPSFSTRSFPHPLRT